MIRFHTLKRRQWIARPLADIFPFFSDASNLALLTPEWLGLRILTPMPVPMAPGAEIRYRMSWHGVPISWTTRIRRWDPPRSFSDIQLGGPYALWHHTHMFKEENGGTLITDVIRYRLPLGFIGRIVHRLTVRRDLENAFAYRSDRLRELFPAA